MPEKNTPTPLTPEQFRALKLHVQTVQICEAGELRTLTVLAVDPSSLPPGQSTGSDPLTH